jgi:hypothetical protein
VPLYPDQTYFRQFNVPICYSYAAFLVVSGIAEPIYIFLLEVWETNIRASKEIAVRGLKIQLRVCKCKAIDFLQPGELIFILGGRVV